ncbi:MAG: TetR/AcrR family transcriptional regulator [Proteobacteria bacterium]|nr:TetR/AcrR family transcriptional regulator [Pseudomonadota bacterium]
MKTKEKILIGARDFLLKYGQGGFTVRSVANESGVNQGLIHHYFGSKENLVLELIDYISIEPFERAKEMAKDVSKSEIKNVILEVLLKNSQLMNLLIEFFYFAQHSPTIKEKVKGVMKERREFITEALEIDEDEDKYLLNAAIFGAIFVNRIDDKVGVEKLLMKVFERFNLIG